MMVRGMNKAHFGIMAAVFAVAGTTANAEVVLIDFGNDISFRGASVPGGVDGNGNAWNSVWSGAFYSDLVNTAGVATNIDFGFSSATGTDYFNGPSGPNQDPSQSVYNAAALGLLGVDEAVYDYYVTSTFQIQGLEAGLTYDLTFFGSHAFSNDATTRYTAYEDGSFSTAIDSVDLDVQDQAMPWMHNQDTTASLSGLTADENGIIYIGFAGANGGDGYLNAMQITVVPAPGAAVLLAGGGLIATRRRR
jgi:hypothetical protein